MASPFWVATRPTLLNALLALGAIAATIAPKPALSAEAIRFSTGLVEFTLPVESLETFAETGTIDSKVQFLGRLTGPVGLAQLRPLLQRRIKLDPIAINQFGYTTVGVTLLSDLGQIIQTGSGRNGMIAMRAALTLAASDPEGVSILSLIRQFPTPDVKIRVEELTRLTQSLQVLVEYRDAAVMAIAQQSAQAAAAEPQIDFSQRLDLRQPGEFTVTRTELTVTSPSYATVLTGEPVERQFEVDVYLPGLPAAAPSNTAPNTTPNIAPQADPAPVVVLSHGLASQRADLSFLANHLASHGFAVVVPEHVGSDVTYQNSVSAAERYDASNPAEFIDRPQDVRLALDELERLSQSPSPSDAAWRDRLDLSRVGLIGHSYGGYTALALAGADLDIARLRQICTGDRPLANFSVLLQCDAATLPDDHYRLRDPRIQAAIALTPVAGSIFGPTNIAKIDIPLMLVSGSDDVLTPAITEQIHPFVWLTQPDRYLAMMTSGNHAGFFPQLGGTEQSLGLVLDFTKGPDPILGSEYVKALSLAMMEVYIAQDETYRPYLSASYAAFLSRAPLPLSLVRSLTSAQLETAYGETPPIPVVP